MENNSQPGGPEDEEFGNKLAVFKFLVASGWKIKQSQFYAHCKDGLLRPEKSGKYSHKKINKYAEKWLRRQETGEKLADTADRLAEEKQKAEVRLLKARIAKEERALEISKKKYVSREEVDAQIIGRAVAFMTQISHAIQEEAPNIIDICQGKHGQTGAVITALAALVERAMESFAQPMDFDIIIDQKYDQSDQNKKDTKLDFRSPQRSLF
ncbi:MAG: hypothetical protein LBU39_01065 [Desulfobulbaceae bacterium]|nr:hypothetical protein [Desulfobulbaceae bacterium]